MTSWVHRAVDGSARREATDFEPPLQPVVPGRGYPRFHVELDGFTFRFASLAELRECMRVLGQRVLPTSLALSEAWGTGAGPNSHWLSRLPATVTPWRYRERAVRYLGKARLAFEKEIGSAE